MKFIPDGLVEKLSKTLLSAKEDSPHIFFAVGVVGICAGTVLACKATLKLEKEIDEIRTDLQDVKDLADPKYHDGMVYTDQQYSKELTRVYAKSAFKIGKLYAPAIIVGGAGILSITGSHVQLSRRNTALTMTLAAVSKAFDEYRIRVREEIGEERELDIHRGVHEEKHKIDGKNQIVKVKDPGQGSIYARLFDEGNSNWFKNAEQNRFFLQSQQNYANQRLNSRGHLFLNEVYDSLGFDHSQAGALVGWVKDSEEGDGFIDFGIYEAYENQYVSENEPRIWLDFNVDGVIYKKIKE